MVGYFENVDIDFDPGTQIDLHSSQGMQDAFVSKFDSDGNFQWAKTWGGPDLPPILVPPGVLGVSCNQNMFPRRAQPVGGTYSHTQILSAFCNSKNCAV